MQQNSFHGILVNMAFDDKKYPESLSLFSKKIAGDWILYGVNVENNDLEKTINEIQDKMRSDQIFYNHLYNDEILIVIFKNKIFRVNSHKSSWKEIVEYGLSFDIPIEQLDFWPNRFQDEIHYFT